MERLDAGCFMTTAQSSEWRSPGDAFSSNSSLDTITDLEGGDTGVVTAVREDNVFLVQGTESGPVEVPYTELKLHIPSLLEDCPRKYDFVVQSHLLRMKFGLRARHIYEILKEAEGGAEHVTSEALVNTTWLTRHALEVLDSKVLLKRLCGTSGGSKHSWQIYLSNKDLWDCIVSLMEEGGSRQDMVRKHVMAGYFFPRVDTQQKEVASTSVPCLPTTLTPTVCP